MKHNNRHLEICLKSVSKDYTRSHIHVLSVYTPIFSFVKTFLLNTQSFSWEFMLLGYAFRKEGLF